MFATLLAVAAATILPECSTLPTKHWQLAEAQYDVIAEDRSGITPDRVRARSSHKKWASPLNDIFFGDENWLALDALKPTVCGPVREVEMFGHLLSHDESDVHFTVVPALPTHALLAGLSPAKLKMCRVPGAGSAKEPCLFGEVTPNVSYERQLCTPQCTSNGTNYTGKPWDEIRNVCVRGPIVLELMHGFRPEVHPSELIWTRFRSSPPQWFVMVNRDASQRFDHPFYFAPWPSGTFGPWSTTATARFDIWFVADAGPDPSFTLKPRVGLMPDNPVKIGIGGTATPLPKGLTAVAEYVCQDGTTRRRGRLRVEVEALQRGEKNKGGRDGQSHAVALEIVQNAAPDHSFSSAAATTTTTPAPSHSPVARPPLELVALARKIPRSPGEDRPHRVELDAIFVTDPDRDEDELYAVEELNNGRHRGADGSLELVGKRQFQIEASIFTEPARPIRPMEPSKLSQGCGQALEKDEVLVSVSVNGQADIALAGPNMVKGPLPPPVRPSELSPDMEGRPPRRPGIATIDICVPESVKTVSVRSAVRSTQPDRELKSETSIDATAACASAGEILEREATALSIPAPTIAKLLESGERVVALVDAEALASDEGELPMLARASYALALAMAEDCPKELGAHKPGGRAVLKGLLQKYGAR